MLPGGTRVIYTCDLLYLLYLLYDMFPGMVLYCTDSAPPLTTAREALDDLENDLFAVCTIFQNGRSPNIWGLSLIHI